MGRTQLFGGGSTAREGERAIAEMFTGIVRGGARISSIVREGDITHLKVTFPQGSLTGIEVGASIAINGCCLTVVSYSGQDAAFDLVPETIKRTTFRNSQQEDSVHFERSLAFGDEVGGHLLAGHIDAVAEVVAVEELVGGRNVSFKLPAQFIKYVLPKGYIAVMGASLTVVSVEQSKGVFSVSLIPETLRVTMFDRISVGDMVNIEIDRTTQAIVDTVERVLKDRR